VRDLITVAQKELRELFAERHSRRAVVLQSGVFVLVMGVLNPMSSTEAWLKASPMAVLPFLMLPGFLAATVAADTFAGERERHTLETLLATPLSEWAILLGKLAASVTFALLLATGGTLAALVTLATTQHIVVTSPLFLLEIAAAALTSGCVLTSVAMVVSLRVPVARSAQQVSVMTGLALAALVVSAWRLLGAETSWRTLGLTEAALLAAAGCVLAVGRSQFRRERLLQR
jgi:ABC-2 type transport system permease protein